MDVKRNSEINMAAIIFPRTKLRSAIIKKNTALEHCSNAVFRVEHIFYFSFGLNANLHKAIPQNCKVAKRRRAHCIERSLGETKFVTRRLETCEYSNLTRDRMWAPCTVFTISNVCALMQSSCCLNIVTAVCILRLHCITHLYKIAAVSYYQ